MVVYTKFDELDLLPHDWSLTIWSEESPVRIEHADGIQSSSFKVQTLTETIKPINLKMDIAGAGPLAMTNREVQSRQILSLRIPIETTFTATNAGEYWIYFTLPGHHISFATDTESELGDQTPWVANLEEVAL